MAKRRHSGLHGTGRERGAERGEDRAEDRSEARGASELGEPVEAQG